MTEKTTTKRDERHENDQPISVVNRNSRVLTYGDVNEVSDETVVTWAWADRDADLDGGFYLLVTDDQTLAVRCDDCGVTCRPVGDAYSQYDADHAARKAEHVEIATGLLVDLPPTDKRVVCDDCVESVPSEFGTKTVYDRETTVQYYQLDPNPVDGLRPLGDVQRAVLRGLLEATVARNALNSWMVEDRDNPWISRVDVTRRASQHYNAATEGATSAAISRAVHSLVDRGLVVGAYRGWFTWYGESPMMNGKRLEHVEGSIQQSEHPDDAWYDPDKRRPTLEKVALRNAGKYVAALVVVTDLNGGGGT